MTTTIRFLRCALSLVFVSFIVTISTVLKTGDLERGIVDPDFPVYATSYVDARGWPFPFLGDNPLKKDFGKMGFEDKFFLYVFMVDWVLILFLILLFLPCRQDGN